MLARNWYLCLPLAAGMVLTACEGEEGRPIYTTYPNTIWETLTGNAEIKGDVSKFVELGMPAGVDVFLNRDQATFTVMVPSNGAFSAATGLPTDPVEVNALLRFHMLAGWIDTALLKLGGEFNTITSTIVTVDVEGSTYTVFDHLGASAKFTKTDVFCKNGVIHIIDKVLTPPPPPPVCGDGNMDAGEACDDGNMMDGDGCSAMCATEMAMPGKLAMVLMTEGFTGLLGAIMGTPIATTLDGAGPFTVFAPDNAAITAAMLTGVHADVVQNIAHHHVVSGKIMKDGLVAASPLTTLANLELDVTAAMVGGVAFGTKTDIQAMNGVIHSVAGLIKPPTAFEFINDDTHLMRTNQAIGIASADLGDLDPDTLGAAHDGPVTIFAPSNMAWMDAGINDVTMVGTSTLANILKAHAVDGQFLLSQLTEGQVLMLVNGSTATVHVNGTVITIVSGMQTATIENDNSDRRTLSGAVHVVDKLLEVDGTPN